jgi:glycosyltransferase involved in cell wall biosynthesis
MHDCKNDDIVFPGWVSSHSLDELLTHAMLFVLPSDLEGLSRALLDAMGAGVCVLTSDIPESLEVVNGAGFTFQAGDVNDLKRKLRTLIADSHLRDVAGQSALRQIKRQYLWPGIAQQVEQVYLELAGRRKPVTALPILEPIPAAESEIPRAG